MVNPKFAVPVRIDLTAGDGMYCAVFLRQNQRIVEMICDDRRFFPVRTRDKIMLVNKDHVVRIEIMTQEEMKLKAEFLPPLDMYYIDNNSW